MLNAKLKRTSIALILAVVLMLSLFPVAAYALEDAGSAAEDEAGIILDAAQTPDATESTPAETEAETEAESSAETSSDTAADDHDHDHDHDDETTEEEKGLTTGDIISLAILGVVIILVVIYCLTHKEKVAKLWRGLKSELKKIVWTPWNQVRKNTLVVLVIIIAAAILIGVLDLLFSKGILALGKIF